MNWFRGPALLFCAAWLLALAIPAAADTAADVERLVKAGQTASPALTVRVCGGLACEMAGAGELLQRLPALLGREVRVIPAPCIGRCEQAPAAVVGQAPVAQATVDKVAAQVRSGVTADRAPAAIDHAAYVSGGGYRLLKQCIAGEREVDAVIRAVLC